MTMSNNYTSDNFSGCKVTVPLEEGDQLDLMVKDSDSGQWEKVYSTRRNRFVFTSRPLSELVEIGYEEPSNPSSARAKDVYVNFYKDICWNIIDNSTGNPFIFSSSGSYQPFSRLGGEWEKISVDMLDRDDPDCDIQVIRMSLPDGSYTLNFFNPVTEEKMVINLEI